MAASSPKPESGSVESALVYPLNCFYAASGLAVPALHPTLPAEMPEPYRGLLVHQGDMTPALEAFHHVPMALRVLRSWREGEAFFREVLLLAGSAGPPAEYGAIRIELRHFDEASRRDILSCARPLGSIMNTNHVGHLSRPIGYFQVAPDAHIREALGVTHPVLYGRRNRLLTADGEVLAEIVEILP